MSKQLGILFKGEMVRAILEGRKTQTRRGIKSDANNIYWNPVIVRGKYGWTDEHGYPVRCDWKVGDYLYVKETWWQYGHWEHVVPHEGTFEGDTEWKRGAGEIKFFTDYPTAPDITYAGHIKSIWRKMSSLFLRKDDARIWLKVTNVRVERLLDISEADAIAEGIISHKGVPGEYPSETMYKDYLGTSCVISPIHSYFTLWDSINGAGSHKENGWVWVIEFERCEKP